MVLEKLKNRLLKENKTTVDKKKKKIYNWLKDVCWKRRKIILEKQNKFQKIEDLNNGD